jgi:putative PIN family toxin of toxin-antitoxin system
VRSATTAFAIIDTNVVVAGLLSAQPTSPVAQILDSMLSATLPFVLSPELLAEYRSVLLRPKIVARHRLAPTEVDAILTDIAHHSIVLDPGPTPAHRQLAPDPGDQLLWDLLALRLDLVLVTGDQRLLSSEDMAPRVLTPAAWVGRQSH